MELEQNKYSSLKEIIGDLLIEGRKQSGFAINTILVKTYWQIGRHIVKFEQGGKERAVYGTSLIDRLSKDLTQEFGRGFSRSNLKSIRQLYLLFPKGQTMSDQLSWSHYV